jgi:anti-sigma B factor antagonist
VSPGVPALRTTVQRSGRSVVLCAHGELDLATAPELRRALASATAGEAVDLVVDLSGVTFVDASGLAALLEAAQGLRSSGGELRLTSPSRMLRRMLAVLDLEGRLPVAGT